MLGMRFPKEVQCPRRATSRVACLFCAGPTEATVAVTWGRVDQLTEAQPVTIGRPDANVHCYVVAPQQAPGPLALEGTAALVPVGAPGELLLSGPRLARGYAQRPEQTAAAFVPNPCYSAAEGLVPENLRHHFHKAYRTGVQACTLGQPLTGCWACCAGHAALGCTKALLVA